MVTFYQGFFKTMSSLIARLKTLFIRATIRLTVAGLYFDPNLCFDLSILSWKLSTILGLILSADILPKDFFSGFEDECMVILKVSESGNQAYYGKAPASVRAFLFGIECRNEVSYGLRTLRRILDDL
jgi:hypothetical protein